MLHDNSQCCYGIAVLPVLNLLGDEYFIEIFLSNRGCPTLDFKYSYKSA